MKPPVSVCIDWLSYTVRWTSPLIHNLKDPAFIHLIAEKVTGLSTKWVEERPLHGYVKAVSPVDLAGLRVMVSSGGHAMGVHVSWSGSALGGRDWQALLDIATGHDAQVTRLDIAVDVEEQWTIEVFRNAFRAGEAVCAARTWRFINSATGDTFYAGSRLSEQYLRIYDKGAQMGTRHPWTRIELELKGDKARTIARFLNADGLKSIPAIIRGFCDFPDKEAWVAVMDAPTHAIGAPQHEKRKDTMKWLMDTVAPVVGRLLRDDFKKYIEFQEKVLTVGGVGEGSDDHDPFDGAADFDVQF